MRADSANVGKLLVGEGGLYCPLVIVRNQKRQPILFVGLIIGPGPGSGSALVAGIALLERGRVNQSRD